MKILVSGLLSALALSCAAPAVAATVDQGRHDAAMQPDTRSGHDGGDRRADYRQSQYGRPSGGEDHDRQGGSYTQFGYAGENVQQDQGRRHGRRPVCTWRHHHRVCFRR
jgi:hypothetical protein